MSDLVERLRKLTGDVPPRGHVVLAEEAADRIEALEAALREAVPCLEDSGYLPQAKVARAALNPEK